MKILQLHSDFIEYKPIAKEIPLAEKCEEKVMRYEDVVVLFVAVEEGDTESVVQRSIVDAKSFLAKLKANRLLIYPYAHLSTNLAKPADALKIVVNMEKNAKELGIECYRAPFGWNKQFTISVKGHPLAEQSRTYSVEGLIEKKEEKNILRKEYLILTPDGKTWTPEEYVYRPEEKYFRLLVEKEALGKESLAKGEPQYIRHMKKFGIDWETMSDIGHMRYSPEGSIIYDSIASYAQSIIDNIPIAIYNVKGSNMFNLNLPPVREHAELFGDRLYRLTSDDRDFVMRYAACHQQFAIIRHWLISYRNLPFGAFEVADSYRLEQSGELLLSFRTRRMNMPDLHIFCSEVEETKDWFFKLHKLIYEEIKKLNRNYYSLYNLTSKEFFETHKDWFQQLVEYEEKPVLLCFYPKNTSYYWVLNIEYHIIDTLNRPREIGTIQIDVGNAKRFGIRYVNRDGKEAYPLIIHSAIIGTIERYLYTLFDTALRMEKPSLPIWASPIQVRLVPVSSEHLPYVRSVAEALIKAKIRADIDDREITVSKKVREAETMWIPYIAVAGKKETKDTTISVRVRGKEKQVVCTVPQIISRIEKEIAEKPRLPSNLPVLLSTRPKFS